MSPKPALAILLALTLAACNSAGNQTRAAFRAQANRAASSAGTFAGAFVSSLATSATPTSKAQDAFNTVTSIRSSKPDFLRRHDALKNDLNAVANSAISILQQSGNKITPAAQKQLHISLQAAIKRADNISKRNNESWTNKLTASSIRDQLSGI